jgi:hypothetical protein
MKDRLLEQIDNFISGDSDYDDELFGRMADFILELDDDQLSDNQLNEWELIISDLDSDDISEVEMAKRSSSQKRAQAKRYYRSNKAKIRRKIKTFAKSSAGKTWARKSKQMARSGKTVTGRKKVKYH